MNFQPHKYVAGDNGAKKKARQKQKRNQSRKKRERDRASGRVQAVRQATRDRMRNLRSRQSNEKNEQDRENARERMANHREKRSEQQQEAEKQKNTKARYNKRQKTSNEKNEQDRANVRAGMANLRKKRSKQEREAEKQKNTKARYDRRQKTKHDKRQIPSTRRNLDFAEDRDILSDRDIKKSKETALKYLHRTLDPETGKHQAHVCVVCDCFILGTQQLKRLNTKQLKAHENRLSVDRYLSFYNIDEVPTSLRNYYYVSGFPKMLLSPRSNLKKGDGYSCCQSCFTAMRPCLRDKKPPKLSIANGFLIGEIPILKYVDDNGNERELDVEEDINEVTRGLLSPLRTHGYVFGYTGGQHKSIVGHYQFFEMDQIKVGSAINYIRHNEKRRHVFCMLAGRMTPNQKKIVRNHCVVDTNKYCAISKWFIEKSGHPGFQNVPIPSDCPQPVLIEDKENHNNTDAPMNTGVEDTIVGGSYFLSTAQDPNSKTSVYGTDRKFTVALMNRSTPKLLVYGGNYANLSELPLENLLPFAFPYGLGTPKQKRPVRVSFEACIQRYMRLAMHQFMRGDVILVLNHIYGRQLSYKSGVMTSRANVGGQLLGENFSKIPVEELQEAADETNPRQSSLVSKLMKSISTSCRALGHTPEAAQFARRFCFAMQDYFGLNSVFVTITPCDECSFRVRLLTTPGVKVSFIVREDKNLRYVLFHPTFSLY